MAGLQKTSVYPFLSSFSLNPRIIRTALILAAIVSGAAFLVMLALRMKLAVSTNSDIGGVEQNVIYGLQLMLDGQRLYTDPADLPFYINQYTPVYHYLCYLTALVISSGPDDIYQLYLIGRIWTLVFNVLSMIALAGMAYRFLKLPRTVALTIACCSFIFIYRQGFCARADSMLDATILWSIYFFMSYLASAVKTSAQLALPLLLAVLSIFVKQSGMQLPVIFIGFLLFNSGFKTVLTAAGTTLLLFAVVFISFTLIYGEPFIKNVVGGVDNGISYLWVKNFLWGNGLKTKVLLPAMLCGYIIFLRGLIFSGTIMERFLAYCVLGTFIFNAVISFKAGSNIQYFFVFTNLSLLLIVYYFFGRYYEKGKNNLKGLYQYSVASFSFGLLLLLMAANLHHQYKWIRLVEFDVKDVIVSKEKLAAEVAAFVQSVNKNNDYVFADLSNEREDLSHSGRRCVNNILYRTCVVPGLDVLDVSSVKSKVFGYANFEKYLVNGKIRFIIQGSPANKLKIPNVYKIRDEYFKVIRVMGGYTVYQHN